jgi:ATP-dependent DNA helicase Q4
MKPRSILAVTATAGDRVIQDICHTLGIPSKTNGATDSEDSILIVDKPRDNIDVNCQFVKSDDERLQMVCPTLIDPLLFCIDVKTHQSLQLAMILKPKPSEEKSEMHTFAGALAKGSVIVYVWRQRDTEIAAETLLSSGVKGGVVIYHGGMDATARSKAQSKVRTGCWIGSTIVHTTKSLT